MAELIGTIVFVFINKATGFSMTVQAALDGGSVSHLQGALGAGLGLMVRLQKKMFFALQHRQELLVFLALTLASLLQLGILVTAEVSGGHFNPTIRF